MKVSNRFFSILSLLILPIAQPAFGQVTFTPVTDDPVVGDGAWSWGASWGDFDNDGYIDLFVGHAFANPDNPIAAENFLYRNRGDGSFERITGEPVATDDGDSNGGVWGDFDNDGFLDLLVTNWSKPQTDFLYRNLGDGTFERVMDPALDRDPLSLGGGGAWVDYDHDGFLDIFVPIVSNDNPGSAAERNVLLRNRGDRTFAREMDGAIATDAFPSTNGAWGDFDLDGWIDLFVTNTRHTGGSGFNNNLYRNLGGGEFERIGDTPVADSNNPSQVAVWADYDNDGDLDLFVTNGFEVPNELYRNDLENGFTRITDTPLTAFSEASGGAAFGDYDNDGDLDLYVANSRAQTSNHLFRNDGPDGFTRITAEAGAPVTDVQGSAAAAWGDYDNDGALDLFVGNLNRNNALYRNDGNDNHWLLIRCQGTESNRSAIGATVRVLATIDGEPTWQLRQISGSSTFGGQNDLRPHFGLGDAETVEVLRIEWPSGIVQELHDVAVNQILDVTEPPRLTITHAVVLSWPLAAEGYRLESAPAADGPWTMVDREVAPREGQLTVTVEVTENARLFRLVN